MTTDIHRLQYLYADLEVQHLTRFDENSNAQKEINDLELSYLKNDVLPSVCSYIAWLLSKIKCRAEISMQYDGLGQLSYVIGKEGSSVLIKGTYDESEQETNNTTSHPVDNIMEVEEKEKGCDTNYTSTQNHVLTEQLGNPQHALSQKYIAKFRDMRSSKKDGVRGPHKAIFLITLLQGIADGTFNENYFIVDSYLKKRYSQTWHKYCNASQLSIFHAKLQVPFIHLSSEPFYHLKLIRPIAINGIDTQLTRVQFGTTKSYYASLDENLFELAKNNKYRMELIRELISSYDLIEN